jgi:hypothetical protein
VPVRAEPVQPDHACLRVGAGLYFERVEHVQ